MSTSNDILHEYLQVSRQISQKFRVYYGKMNLTYPQSIVLAILQADGPMPISALAEAAGSANSTISGILDRLEFMGLVRRERSDADRRVIYASVTEQFSKSFEKMQNNTADQFQQAINSLSATELEAVRRGLVLLNLALQESDR